jgi:hypothetical protein
VKMRIPESVGDKNWREKGDFVTSDNFSRVYRAARSGARNRLASHVISLAGVSLHVS